jgi:asparagine synthase (glutamine-hydrolysing)
MVRNRLNLRAPEGLLVLERGCWSPRSLVATASVAPSYYARLRARVTNDLGPLIDDVLPDGELVSSGFLRRPPLRQLVTDQRSGRRDQSSIMELLFMGLWVPGRSGCGGRATVSGLR